MSKQLVPEHEGPEKRQFALALQDYLRRRENKNLLAQINAAQPEEMEASEKNLRQKSKRTHRRLVESEW